MVTSISEDSSKRALNAIDENDLIEATRELVRIHGENPLGLYEEITGYLAKKWKTIGLKTQIAKVPDTIVNGCGLEGPRMNLIGTFGGRQQSALIFDGHMDTVQVGEGWTTDP